MLSVSVREVGWSGGVAAAAVELDIFPIYWGIFSCPEQLLKSSCRSICPSIGRSARWSVSLYLCKKVIFRVSYLWDSSYSSDSIDSSDSSNSSDNSDNIDSSDSNDNSDSSD